MKDKTEKNTDTIDLNPEAIDQDRYDPKIDLRKIPLGTSKVYEWSDELKQWVEVPDDE